MVATHVGFTARWEGLGLQGAVPQQRSPAPEQPEDGRDSPLTATVRRSGRRVWDEAQREPLCEPLQAFNSHVRALTTDETGAAWVGSDKGNVK